MTQRHYAGTATRDFILTFGTTDDPLDGILTMRRIRDRYRQGATVQAMEDQIMLRTEFVKDRRGDPTQRMRYRREAIELRAMLKEGRK